MLRTGEARMERKHDVADDDDDGDDEGGRGRLNERRPVPGSKSFRQIII